MEKIKKINVIESPSRDGTKIYYTLEWGRRTGQRQATGLYITKKAKTIEQQKFNKDAQIELEKRVNKKFKEVNATSEFDSTTAEQIEENKKKLSSNFLIFYNSFVIENSISTRRHLKSSYNAFKRFIGNKSEIAANEITEKMATAFRDYLMENYNGETPGEYFQCFKKVCKQATEEKYFLLDPTVKVVATKHESSKKEILDVDEWKKVLEMPCSNTEVKRAAIFSLCTGLRWCDVKSLEWKSISNNTLMKKQNKTGRMVEVPLNNTATQWIGERKKSGLVFDLPTDNGANKVLGAWIKSAGVDKHITWHSLRHSLSVFLQDAGESAQTVAGILGHKNATQVIETYSRYSSKQAKIAVDKLPSFSKVEDSEIDINKQLELEKIKRENLKMQLELARLQAKK